MLATIVAMAAFSLNVKALVIRPRWLISQQVRHRSRSTRLASELASATDAVVHTVGRAKNVGSALQYRLGRGAASGLPEGVESGRLFTVLGIETSCDDTGAAVVRSDGVILGEALASQHEIHEEFGGVVPGLARDAHAQNIDNVIGTALRHAGLKPGEVDAVAVTVGPGLEICLRVGATAARKFAHAYAKPFVEVHHLEAHCLLARPHLSYSSAGDQASAANGTTAVPPIVESHAAGEEGAAATLGGGAPSAEMRVDFPFVALLVSGGHCQILLVKGVGSYVVLGGTLDDALGEAYDKAARMLGLRTGGTGGPALEALARDGDPKKVPLPVPMQKRKDCDFSYAGLKNAFRLAVQKAINEHRLSPESPLPSELSSSSPSPSSSSSSSSSSPSPSTNQTAQTRYEANFRNSQAKNVNVEDASGELPYQVRADLAASFQRVAIRHLTDRLTRALDIATNDTARSNAVGLAEISSARNDMPSPPFVVEGAINNGEEGLRGGNGVGVADEGGGGGGDDGGKGSAALGSGARPAVRSLAVVGGVAANQAVRDALAELCAKRSPPITLVAPPPRLCTDNGVMVAWAGIEKLLLRVSDDVNLPDETVDMANETKAARKSRSKDVRPRWPLGPEYSIEL